MSIRACPVVCCLMLIVGGRFLSKATADKYGLDIPEYPGIDQIAEVPARL